MLTGPDLHPSIPAAQEKLPRKFGVHISYSLARRVGFVPEDFVVVESNF